MHYLVWTWNGDEPARRVHRGWKLRDNRADKWRLRRWLRKLYRSGFDRESIRIERHHALVDIDAKPLVRRVNRPVASTGQGELF